ncbi:MAG: class I SAM-dependent methyltransferase [Rhodoplanes sp.]|uniref:class I SAM-dependent methyltransferase n=1 Tax=Rhodoplanes sp. TaxID=1968906 RepID=UPI0017B61CF1|nr:class I SAM-dependent methyltransferase [Rhodoplanes sp.]NVO17012.1 class I SAM-dependent methyltransferase [Rhodoplanes sp.]
MSFPHHDPYWSETAAFVGAHARPGERILAPDIFWWQFDRIYRYADTRLHPDARYDWAVVHKGELAQIAPAVLARITHESIPLFANAVFVVFGPAGRTAALDRESVHLRALAERLAALDAAPPAADPLPSESGQIVKFETLDDVQFRDAMNAFWRAGGYRYDTRRDKAYYEEIDELIATRVGDGAGDTVLDVACGSGRLAGILTAAERVVGVDVSDAAVEIARERHRDQPRFTFAAMDAHRLDFPDGAFDTVLFVDAIEHVRDAAHVLAEIGRVTRPGGRLFLTVANTGSLNQVMARKLGYPEFKTNYQHIAEFSLPQTTALLSAAGFEPEHADGILLFPYWGLPGIDEHVRTITDEDPEVVEILRVLGRRAGPEYAYAFAMLARKVDSPR